MAYILFCFLWSTLPGRASEYSCVPSSVICSCRQKYCPTLGHRQITIGEPFASSLQQGRLLIDICGIRWPLIKVSVRSTYHFLHCPHHKLTPCSPNSTNGAIDLNMKHCLQSTFPLERNQKMTPALGDAWSPRTKGVRRRALHYVLDSADVKR